MHPHYKISLLFHRSDRRRTDQYGGGCTFLKRHENASKYNGSLVKLKMSIYVIGLYMNVKAWAHSKQSHSGQCGIGKRDLIEWTGIENWIQNYESIRKRSVDPNPPLHSLM